MYFQIHSITARSVPKDQLEKLRRYSDEERPKQNIPSRLAETETRNPGRATALTTGQQIKLVPEQPKQVFQSSNLNGQTSASAKVKVQSPRQNIIKPPVSNSNPAKSQPIKITLTNNINRPLSPVQSEPVQQTCQPIKVHVAGKAEAPKTPSQSNNPSQTVKTGSEIDTPEGRKSPKIRTGAISAMSRFWEKRLNEGETDGEYPELLDN